MEDHSPHRRPLGSRSGPRRRTFLAGGAAGLAAVAVPGWPLRAASAHRPPLPIPAELRADAGGRIALAARPGTMTFRPGVETSTYGFNGAYLGPALRLRRGDRVTMDVENGIDADITAHWHGLIIPGEADGGPHAIIKPGARWTVPLDIDQPAATLWFHPHIYPQTAELVARGLAGLIVIDDEEADGLGLPSTWGVDDIPIVIQDRRFSPDGSIFHRFNLAAVTVGYVGDTVLVNGAQHPTARTARGWLRLRILNGSNARSYRLAASDDRTLYVIGSDGGLLPEPVDMAELEIHAGERYEVMVDARDGMPFDLLTLPVSQLAMALPPFHGPLSILTITPDGNDGKGRLPERLATLPALPARPPAVSQELVMDMNLDDKGMAIFKEAGLMEMMASGRMDPAVVKRVVAAILDGPPLPPETLLTANAVNGQSFSMTRMNFAAPRGQPLRWRISEGADMMLHPVHVHGCQFRILTLDGKPPPAHQAGWKDIAPISKGGAAEILVTFPLTAPANAPYMAHCHILEHEDSGMMAQFTVA